MGAVYGPRNRSPDVGGSADPNRPGSLLCQAGQNHWGRRSMRMSPATRSLSRGSVRELDDVRRSARPFIPILMSLISGPGSERARLSMDLYVWQAS